MAQIGTPPAGWYTDPSGQHHARYWDGWSWTEDVRDDLVPSAARGEIPAHPVAETVASVAEAVAAVAANDVASARTWAPDGDDPPLVVDYGTGDPANGAMPTVPDPFASPLRTPAFEPTPTGPVPAWYPDPAASHEARFWDGTRWTERVADRGQEGVDPLPGVAPPTTAISWTNTDFSIPAVDPTAALAVTGEPVPGRWNETRPSTDSPRLGDDGRPLTAGQISLATLPAVDESDTERAPRAVRPSVKVRVAGGFVLAGAIALLVGSISTWIDVTGPRVGEQWTATGVDLGDGRITVALAVVLALLGAVLVTGRLARFGGAKVAAMGALVAGAAATAVTAVDIADVADRAARLGVPAGAVSNVGTGLWVAFVGALFAVAGGLMAFANRR